MAIDKKSDHVGNHGGRYTDIDGQSKQFTYVDHDIKPKMSSYISDPSIHEQVKKDREQLVDKILSIPAVYAHSNHDDFTVRGDRERVIWNEIMLRDEGLPYDRLREIYTLANNKLSLLQQGITP